MGRCTGQCVIGVGDGRKWREFLPESFFFCCYIGGETV